MRASKVNESIQNGGEAHVDIAAVTESGTSDQTVVSDISECMQSKQRSRSETLLKSRKL